MAIDTNSGLTGVEKAAVLVVALGADKAAEVLARLSADEVEQIARQIAAMPVIDAQTRQAVVAEVIGDHSAPADSSVGGPSYARLLTQRAFDPAGAGAPPTDREVTLDALEPPQLAALLRDEHPQTIAFVISQLTSPRAAAVFAALPGDLQTQVAVRMVGLETTPPEALHELRKTVSDRLTGLLTARAVGGTEALAGLLEHADRATERGVLASLEQAAPRLASDVRRRVFTFEDLAKLEPRLLQRVIRETSPQELALALAGADADVLRAVLENVSQRQAAAIQEDLESLESIRLRDVEAAQRQMTARARQLTGGEVAGPAAQEGWAVA